MNGFLEKVGKLFWKGELKWMACVECETALNYIYQITPFTTFFHFLFGVIKLKIPYGLNMDSEFS